MAKIRLGPYSQRNIGQMGDGHGKGASAILKDGSFGKKQNENWKAYVLRPRHNASPPPQNKDEQTKPLATWKQKVLATKAPATNYSKQVPSTRTKQISPVKAVKKISPVMRRGK